MVLLIVPLVLLNAIERFVKVPLKNPCPLEKGLPLEILNLQLEVSIDQTHVFPSEIFVKDRSADVHREGCP